MSLPIGKWAVFAGRGQQSCSSFFWTVFQQSTCTQLPSLEQQSIQSCRAAWRQCSWERMATNAWLPWHIGPPILPRRGPSAPAAVPLLSLLVRRLQLGAPRLRQLSTPCPGAVEAGLCRILELEAAGGTGYEANELEPAGPWMRQLLQRAGGAAGARAAEAAWLRGVWGPEAGPPEWLDPWRLPAWNDE